jgi:hypothetical protein
MKNKTDKKNLIDEHSGNKEKKDLKGYPLYPGSEDIFNKSDKAKDINPDDCSGPDDCSKTKRSGVKVGKFNEKDFDDDISGNDLDIPGAELDDEQENVGSEDEENNYYSLGGDDHENLDEDKGD